MDDPLHQASPQFALTPEERFRHTIVIGRSGTGKSTHLFNQAIADIEAGEGIAFIDPHGDEAKRLIDAIPPSRTNDVVLFDVTDTDFPIAFNVTSNVPPAERHQRVAAIVSSMAHVFALDGSWGHQTAQLVHHGVFTLMDANMSILALPRLFLDDDFRKRLIPQATDPIVRQYWARGFEEYRKELQDSKTAPPLNKIEELLSAPAVRNILGAPKNKIDLRHIIDSRKILIANLSKGRLSKTATNLFGSLLLTLIANAGYAREDTPEHARVPFYVYTDEFPNFASLAFSEWIAELRKYKLGLVLAAQWLDQVHADIRAALLAGVNTIIAFEVGAADAEILAQKFDGLDPSELALQSKGRAWVRSDRSFSAWTDSRRAPFQFPDRRQVHRGRADAVISRSRRSYCNPRNAVEANMYRNFSSTKSSAKAPPVPPPMTPLSAPHISATLRAEFLAAIDRLSAGDGLSESKSSARYAPRLLAEEFDYSWSVAELTDVMGRLLAMGEIKSIKVKRDGRPPTTTLVRNSAP